MKIPLEGKNQKFSYNQRNGEMECFDSEDIRERAALRSSKEASHKYHIKGRECRASKKTELTRSSRGLGHSRSTVASPAPNRKTINNVRKGEGGG